MERSTKGGLIVVGSLNLGGSVEMIPIPGLLPSWRSRRGGSASHADLGSEAAPRPARRYGDQGEHRVLRGPGGRLYEGDSRMRPFCADEIASLVLGKKSGVPRCAAHTSPQHTKRQTPQPRHRRQGRRRRRHPPPKTPNPNPKTVRCCNSYPKDKFGYSLTSCTINGAKVVEKNITKLFTKVNL